MEACISLQAILSISSNKRIFAVEGPKENRQSVIDQSGWEDWLLDLLLDSSPVMQAHAAPLSAQGTGFSTSSQPGRDTGRSLSSVVREPLDPAEAATYEE